MRIQSIVESDRLHRKPWVTFILQNHHNCQRQPDNYASCKNVSGLIHEHQIHPYHKLSGVVALAHLDERALEASTLGNSGTGTA